MLESYFRYLYKDVTSLSRKNMLTLLKEPAENLLDLGCWDGKNTVLYGKQAASKNLFGIELEQTKAKEAQGRGVQVSIGNLNEKLPFSSGSMNALVANHVIEHLTQTELFISEMHRVLKKGGYGVIATPNLASWHNIFALLLGMQPFSGPHVKISDHEIAIAKNMDKEKASKVLQSSGKGNDYLRHLVILTYRELKKNLVQVGFTIEEEIGMGYYPLPPILARLFSKIDKRHSHYIMIKVRK